MEAAIWSIQDEPHVRMLHAVVLVQQMLLSCTAENLYLECWCL
jgi:hypothetical protein